MNTSGSKVQNEINAGQVKEKLKHIGGGELELWKYTVLTDGKIFKEVFDLIFNEEENIAWKAAWIIDNATEKHPELLAPHIPAIIALFIRTQNSLQHRIFTRMLSRHTPPDELTVTVVDRCYELLSPLHPVAVRANAMQALYNITERWPDLKPELAMVITGIQEEGGTAGIISKSRNLLKKLNKNPQFSKHSVNLKEL